MVRGDPPDAKLSPEDSPEGFDELSRTKILKPTSIARGRDVVWSHPAFANRCVFARNDSEIVCIDLAKH